MKNLITLASRFFVALLLIMTVKIRLLCHSERSEESQIPHYELRITHLDSSSLSFLRMTREIIVILNEVKNLYSEIKGVVKSNDNPVIILIL